MHYLVAKSIVEALLVGTLAVGFYLSAFTPYLRGAVDVADAQHVAGWAVNQAAPQTRVEVQLYIDGRYVGDAVADRSRPDVKAAAQAADEWHGFGFDTPKLERGEHEARVYAMHESGGGARRTLQLVGKPVRFRVNAIGSETSSSGAVVSEQPSH